MSFDLDHPSGPPIYSFYEAKAPFIGVVSIPHSGEFIPPEFEQYLCGSERELNEDVDYKVDELIDLDTLAKSGISIIASHIHRVAVDLNRSEELAILNWEFNSKGRKIVSSRPEYNVLVQLRAKYYAPYFEVLKGQIERESSNEGQKVSMIDLHSMPSKPTAYHMKQNPSQPPTRPDFCLSDRHGITCVPDFIDSICSNLSGHGYQVAKNNPYVGGYITEFVNRFKTNNIQIEINRGLYMDEVEKKLVSSKVDQLRPVLTTSIVNLFKKFAI